MKIITVCGSYKYKKEMTEITEKMAFLGNCMITPIDLSKQSKEAYTKEQLEILGKMHKEKIKELNRITAEIEEVFPEKSFKMDGILVGNIDGTSIWNYFV